MGIFFAFGFGLIGWILVDPRFSKRFVGEASAESLAIIRIISCISLLINVLWIIDIPSTAYLPEMMIQRTGMMHYLNSIPGFTEATRNVVFLTALKWITVLLSCMGVVGWKTRYVIPLCTILSILIGGINRQYFYFYHQGLLVSYMLLILSFTPCSDALSVDRLNEISEGKPALDPGRTSDTYGWSRYACWSLVAVAYLASGASKLWISGLLWLDPVNLRGMMYGCTLQRCNNFDWDISLRYGPHMHDALFTLFGIVGSIGEIAFVLVLFSKRARQFLPLLMVGLHLGIFVFQNILFVEFILFQLIFYDYTELKQWMKASFTSSKEADLKRSTSMQGMATSPSSSRLFAQLPQAPSASTRKSQDGGVRLNSEQVGRTKRIDDSFETFAVDELAHQQKSRKNSTSNFRFPLIIATLAMITATCWYYSIKPYPLSSFHLFSYRDLSGVVTYDKIYADVSSGSTARIYPEKIIPAQFVASYRRITSTCFPDNLDDADSLDYCREYFQAVGSVYNSKAHDGSRIERIKVQRWRWDFLSNPLDDDYGEYVNSRSIEIQ
ncbi:hypothetical protein [Synechococcus sp. PCC 7335]|uniref:hypothetical protein n=1 Tax=Synechococcus sp. (strain ATCC 29403 / PCC 7335) TaxID=91464 RepID=UPI00056F80A3|nr:hypothetical protein [Synechococcus sp. PCC 7335]